mgnify:FL=1
MSFATGFVTGLAKTVDDQLKNDMLRTQKRMDGMEQYRITRGRADIEREQKETREVGDMMKNLASLVGGDPYKAAQLYEAGGGTLSGATEFYQTTKKSQAALGKKFDINNVVTLLENDKPNSIPMSDYVKNYVRGANTQVRDDQDFEASGLLGKMFGGSKNYIKTMNSNVKKAVGTSEDKFGLLKVPTPEVKHEAFIEYKQHQKDNRRKYGTTYKADLIILEGELSFTKDPDEKAKLTKEIAQRRADVNLEAANALAGKNKETSFFSKPQIGTLIKETKNGALSGVSSQVQGIDGIISTIIEGKEAEAFQVQRNAFIALKKAYAPAKSDVFNMAIDGQQNAINLEIQNYIKDFTQNRVARKGKKLHDPMTDAEIKTGIKGSSSGTTKTKPLINIGDVVQIKLPNGGVKIAIYTGNDFINDQMPTPVATQ